MRRELREDERKRREKISLRKRDEVEEMGDDIDEGKVIDKREDTEKILTKRERILMRIRDAVEQRDKDERR
jgi:hypothetical protein